MIPLGSAGKFILSERIFSGRSGTAAVLLRRQFHADAAGAQGCGPDLELILQGLVLVNAEGPGDFPARREADAGERVKAAAHGVEAIDIDLGFRGSCVLYGDGGVFA